MNRTVIYFLIAMCLWQLYGVSSIFAQRATRVQCGDVIEGRFSGEESFEYSIQVSEDDILAIHVASTEEYDDDLYLRLFLFDTDGDEIEYVGGRASSGAIGFQTRPLPRSGLYTIYIDNNLYNRDGEYNIYIGCVDNDGNVISNSRFTNGVECGQIINSEFRVSEWHIYFILLNEDDTIDITLQSTEEYDDDLYLRLFLFDTDGDEIEYAGGRASSGAIGFQTRPLPRSGLYTIYIDNNLYNRDGEYTLYIGCVRDGVGIQPGDVPWDEHNDSPSISTGNENTIVVAAGSFQSEIGCSRSQGIGGDWAPECTLSELTDSDGDGVYTWTTDEIPEGNWEVKIAINQNWDENYGEDGESNGESISFRVRDNGQRVTFSYDSSNHILDIRVR